MDITRLTALAGIVGVAMTAAGTPGLAADKRGGDVREFTVGLSADDLPKEGYLGFACGNDGGEAGQEIGGWHDYAACPADENGLYEVAFKYDDSEILFDDLEGTAIAGHPVLISLLFNANSIVEGLRVYTDPAARPYNKRRARVLARKVKARFGMAGWQCEDIPPEGSESEIGGVFTKELCVTDLGNRTVTLYAEFYRTFAGGEEELVNSTHFEIWLKRDTPS